MTLAEHPHLSEAHRHLARVLDLLKQEQRHTHPDNPHIQRARTHVDAAIGYVLIGAGRELELELQEALTFGEKP